MQFQKSVTGIFLLVTTLALAQEQDYVIIKKISPVDSGAHKIFVEHNGNLLDSTGHLFLKIQESLEGIEDSVKKKIYINKMPIHERKIARVIIKKSGFFRKSKIVIDFDPMSQKILHVSDDEKVVPKNKFHKYQNYLEDATEYPELEALHSRMEEFEWQLDLPNLSDSLKIAGIDGLLLDLDSLKSDYARLKKEYYVSAKSIIELKGLVEIIQNVLEESGEAPPQKIEAITIKNGKFFINGDELAGELGKKCIEAYEAHTGNKLSEMGKGKDEKVSIHIQFD